MALHPDSTWFEQAIRRHYVAGRNDLDFPLPVGEFEWTGSGDTVDHGDPAISSFGFRVGRRWTLRGAGQGATIVRIVPREGFNYTGRRVCLYEMLADATGVSFRDLTIDCNWPAFERLGAIGTTGIGGFLDAGFRVERCEFFNHGSVDADGGGAIFPNNILRVARRIVVRDCWIHDGHGLAHGIALASNNHHDRRTILSATVENNLIERTGGIALGIPTGIIEQGQGDKLASLRGMIATMEGLEDLRALVDAGERALRRSLLG